MTVIAFEGPAGSGKTYRLMEELTEALERRPLAEHERVMALTFMHGSRRRLDARLRNIDALSGRHTATTLDSFAWRITQRWQSLARHLGHEMPADVDYERTCELATALLERETVRTWVNQTYPYILVDEAQDLSTERSSMIAALAQQGKILLAYDEFQCLNTALLPIAIENWINAHCEPIVLEGCRRTEEAELIDAAIAVREGRTVTREGKRFKVIATPGHVNFRATCVANAIAWRNGGTIAVLTPSRQGGFANSAVSRVSEGPIGQRQNGPYNILWESSDEQDGAVLWDRLAIKGDCTVDEALEAIARDRHEPAFRTLRNWLKRQRSAKGVQEFSEADLRRQLDKTLSVRRRYGHRIQTEFSAMTIQQAKNREFDHVIILWPYNVPNDDEQKRRLLYNAITRAKRSCTVLVQSEEMLAEPPFSPRVKNL
ncbi:MAG: ATP-binding domain-containing protein [Xanthomonadales bacterium]|nr:ATP-binding domain-containing protein [Xanthomonadales bacterium]